MNKPGRFLSWCFGIGALVFVLVPVSDLWRRLHSHYPTGGTSIGHQTLALTIMLAVGGIFGIAWWTTRKRTFYGRLWAIAASVVQIILGNILVIIRRGPPIWLLTILGVAGLIVFSRRDALAPEGAQPAQASRIPGDGTSRFLDGVAQFAGIAGAWASFSWWARWARSHHLPIRQGDWFWALILAAYLVSVVAHECGHTGAGLALGMKLRAFVIGPFQWHVRRGNWTFSFRPANFLAMDGAAGLAPTHTADWRWRDICMIAAGPFASLCVGTISLWAALNASGRPWERSWEILALTAVTSLVTFGVNLVPIRPEAQYSDGARIYQLLSNGPWVDVHRAFSVVSSSLVTPLRPKDFDIQAIQRAAAFVRRGREALLLRMFAYLHYVDCGRIPEAVEAMKEAESVYELSASDIPPDLHLDFIFGNAFLNQDAARAQLWWDRMEAKNPRRDSADYWLARSALLWIQNLRT